MEKIKVISFEEQENGGAIVTIEFDEEGKNLLLEAGLNKILVDYCDKAEAELKMNPIFSYKGFTF